LGKKHEEKWEKIGKKILKASCFEVSPAFFQWIFGVERFGKMSLDFSARISVQSGRENVTSYKQG